MAGPLIRASLFIAGMGRFEGICRHCVPWGQEADHAALIKAENGATGDNPLKPLRGNRFAEGVDIHYDEM